MYQGKSTENVWKRKFPQMLTGRLVVAIITALSPFQTRVLKNGRPSKIHYKHSENSTYPPFCCVHGGLTTST